MMVFNSTHIPELTVSSISNLVNEQDSISIFRGLSANRRIREIFSRCLSPIFRCWVQFSQSNRGPDLDDFNFSLSPFSASEASLKISNIYKRIQLFTNVVKVSLSYFTAYSSSAQILLPRIIFYYSIKVNIHTYIYHYFNDYLFFIYICTKKILST